MLMHCEGSDDCCEINGTPGAVCTWTRVASCDTDAARSACVRRNSSRDSGMAVSRTVPSANTTRRSFSVWYVFWLTPQHIPDELLATIPPIMHESMDEGSGPILY